MRGIPALIPFLALTSLGCATLEPPVIFVADPPENGLVYYMDGVPFAVGETPCMSLDVGMQPIRFGEIDYVQVLLQLTNETDAPFDFDPGTALGLAIDGPSDYPVTGPDAPYVVLGRFRSEKNQAALGRQVFGIFEAALAQPTRVTTPHGSTYTVDDADVKADRALDRTVRDVAAIVSSRDSALYGLDSQMLRKNTIFPGQTIAGTVFFHLPFADSRQPVGTKELRSHRYVLSVHAPCERVQFRFRVEDGEWGSVPDESGAVTVFGPGGQPSSFDR